MKSKLVYALMSMLFNPYGVPEFMKGEFVKGGKKVLRLAIMCALTMATLGLFALVMGVYMTILSVQGIIHGVEVLKTSDEDFAEEKFYSTKSPKKIVFAILCMLFNPFGVPDFIEGPIAKGGKKIFLLNVSYYLAPVVVAVLGVFGFFRGLETLEMSDEEFAAIERPSFKIPKKIVYAIMCMQLNPYGVPDFMEGKTARGVLKIAILALLPILSPVVAAVLHLFGLFRGLDALDMRDEEFAQRQAWKQQLRSKAVVDAPVKVKKEKKEDSKVTRALKISYATKAEAEAIKQKKKKVKIKKDKVKRTVGERILYFFVFAILATYSAFILYHFFILLQLATRPGGEFTDTLDVNRIATWSRNFTFKNFSQAFTGLKISEETNFLKMTWNSIWFSIGSMLISLFFEASVTYIICKYKFPGRKFMYNLVIFRMMLPIVGSLPSAYRVYDFLGLMNSPLILITATDVLSGANFLIMYSFFKGVSWEYAEAAFIDGANHFKVFFKIMLPMALPAISVLFITGFIGRWNEYLTVSIFMDEMPTLSYGLYLFQEKLGYGVDQGVYYAGVMIAAVPCFALFLIFQNTIMQTVHMGGIKG